MKECVQLLLLGTVVSASQIPLYPWLFEDYYYSDSYYSYQAIRTSNCGESWVANPSLGNCYQIINEKLTWKEARARCNSLDSSELVSLNSEKEQRFVGDMLKLSSTEQRFWIGLTDSEEEGNWQWSDETPVEYLMWSYDDQNNHHGEKDCATAVESEGYRWSDQNCDRIFPAVCEKRGKELTQPTFSPNCGESWIGDPTTGKCYQILNEKLTWMEAREKCTSQGNSELVSLNSAQEQSFVADMLSKSSNEQRFWIGLTDSKEEGNWQWSDETPVEFTIWNYDDPDNSDGEKDCAIAVEWRGYRWSDQNCNRLFPAVCEKKGKVPSCGDSWIADPSTGWCYQVVEEELTWSDARKRCDSLAGDEPADLVSISSREEQDFVYNLTIGKGDPDWPHWWLGFSDIETEGIFKWSDGSPVTYAKWLNGEPNDIGGEDCAEFIPVPGRAWNDVACDRFQYVVCKKSAYYY